MPGPQHPTAKTLAAKLHAAKEALAARPLLEVSAAHVRADMEDLGLTNQSDYWALIPQLIEAALADPTGTYAGGRPPLRSTKHDSIKNLEMWAFQVPLTGYSSPIYFKFCLKVHPRTSEILYCHVDCHPQR